nr:unnamed protein product [Digitaria exilis]
MEGKNEAGERAAACGGASREIVADEAAPVQAGAAEQQREDGDTVPAMEAAAEEVVGEEEETMADSAISRSTGEEGEEGDMAVPWTCACMRRMQGVLPPPTALPVAEARKRKRDVVDPAEDDGSSSSEEEAVAAAAPEEWPTAPLTPRPLQRLLDACRTLFGVPGAPPMSVIVHQIRGIMDTIGPNDVGVRDDVRFFNQMNIRRLQNPPVITTKTIYECNNFKIAAFFIPYGGVMPLHDHPSMTVFSKVIIGAARMKAYDWVLPRVLWRSGPWMLAEKVRDHVVTSALPTWVLFPDAGGNMHRFVAEEVDHCMFLDVLTPPYAPPEQRRCAYYEEHSSDVVSGGQRRQVTWLKEIPQPSNLMIVELPFRGPLIV